MTSPTGLPPRMTGRVLTINGEPYVSLRHVHALFTHTQEGIAFHRTRRRFLTRRAVFFDVVGEDRPQMLLDREFGPLEPAAPADDWRQAARATHSPDPNYAQPAPRDLTSQAPETRHAHARCNQSQARSP